jgi:hypothetical protein
MRLAWHERHGVGFLEALRQFFRQLRYETVPPNLTRIGSHLRDLHDSLLRPHCGSASTEISDLLVACFRGSMFKTSLNDEDIVCLVQKAAQNM